jgi:hypothetical protein
MCSEKTKRILLTLLIILVIFVPSIVLASCAPSVSCDSESDSACVEKSNVLGSDWENISNHTTRFVDKKYGVVCYTIWDSGRNLSCVKINPEEISLSDSNY